MNKPLFLFSGWLLLVLFSCNSKTPKIDEDKKYVGKNKIYKGELSIEADKGIEPVIRQQVEVFSHLYDSVNVTVQYKNEDELLKDFAEKKVGVLLLARELTDAERETYKTRDTIYAREMTIAYDAVALIGNQKFDDKELSLEKLRGLLTSSTPSSDKLQLVFDNSRSSCVSYVLNTLGYREKVSDKVYALNSVEEVIEYVQNHQQVIGFVPFSYLSDTDDEKVIATLKQIKILSLRGKNQKGEDVRVSANQSDIADGSYPLIRTITAVTKFSYGDNLQWLFANFLMKEKGARVFLKAGLIPARMPEREIIVNTEGIKSE